MKGFRMNPLLEDWTTPFDLAPFDKITDEDFAPAFETALAEARANIAHIASNADAPSFANTVEALEQADESLGKVMSVFYNLAGADSTPKREELMRSFSPALADYRSEITMNSDLFDRVDALWQGRADLNLSAEQERVLYLYHRGFVRSGAQLTGPSRTRLKEVMQRLAVLGTEFTQNLLADERAWFMPLGEDDLEGLPDFLIASARAAGEDKGQDGPVITLSRSLIVPFLQFSPRRDLRQKAFAAWAARGANGGKTDNRGIAAETLALRKERATLLDYDSVAAFKLGTEMGTTPQAGEEVAMRGWQGTWGGLRLSDVSLATVGTVASISTI